MNRDINKDMKPMIQYVLVSIALFSGACTAGVITFALLVHYGIIPYGR